MMFMRGLRTLAARTPQLRTMPTARIQWAAPLSATDSVARMADKVLFSVTIDFSASRRSNTLEASRSKHHVEESRRTSPAGSDSSQESEMSDTRTLRNFVDGGYVDSKDGAYADIVDPTNGEVFATAPVSGPADVDAAMSAAST